MTPYMLLTLQGLVIIVGPIALAWRLRQRLGTRWST